MLKMLKYYLYLLYSDSLYPTCYIYISSNNQNLIKEKL